MAQASFSCPSGNSPSGVLTPCTHSPLLCHISFQRGFLTVWGDGQSPVNGFSLVGADAHIGPLGCVSVVPRRPHRQKPLLEERWHAKRDGEVCRRAAAAARKRTPAFVACHDGASDVVAGAVYPNSAISWATRSSLSAMAARVLPSSSSSSQPRRSAP